MKKNAFFAIVVVCALVVSGIGGVLAGFSDTEQSVGNTIITGSLDLKVNGNDDLPYGTGVGAVVAIPAMQPAGVDGKLMYERSIIVQNMGNSTLPDGSNDENAFLYIKFKNMVCDNVEPAHDRAAYEDLWYTSPISNKLKLEPELVTEYGGVLDQIDIIGAWWDPEEPRDPRKATGQIGDNCTLGSSIQVVVLYDGEPIKGPVSMASLKDTWLYVGKLPACGAEHKVQLRFFLPQILDEEWTGDTGMGFEYWMTNGLMNDKLTFDVEFGLTEIAPEPVPSSPFHG